MRNADILKQVNWRARGYLDEDVDVAAGPRVTARHGTEQGSMQHATTPEFRLMGSQRGYHLFAVHSDLILENLTFF